MTTHKRNPLARVAGAVKTADRVTDRWAAPLDRYLSRAGLVYLLQLLWWAVRRVLGWHWWTLRHVPRGLGRIFGGFGRGAGRVVPAKANNATGWLVLIFIGLLAVVVMYAWAIISVAVSIPFDLVELPLYSITGWVFPEGLKQWAVIYAVTMSLGWFGTRGTVPAAMPVAVASEQVRLYDLIRECHDKIGRRTDPDKGNPDALRVGKFVGDEAGRTVTVALPVGFTVADLDRAKLASGWGRDGIPTDRLTITTGQTDRHAVLRFADLSPSEIEAPSWPLAKADSFDLTSPIPAGVDMNGQPVTLDLATSTPTGRRLVGGSLLIGGQSGSGKTSLIRLIASAAALDDTVTLAIFDGKADGDYQSLAPAVDWLREGDETADFDACHAMLGQAVELMRARRDDHTLTRTPVVIILDEYQNITEAGRDDIQALVKVLVNRGRAFGITLIVATQRPTADAIPTKVRDGMLGRVCLKVKSHVAVDAILGQDAFKNGNYVPKTAKPGAAYMEAGGLDGLVQFTKVTDEMAGRAASAHPRQAGVMFPTGPADVDAEIVEGEPVTFTAKVREALEDRDRMSLDELGPRLGTLYVEHDRWRRSIDEAPDDDARDVARLTVRAEIRAELRAEGVDLPNKIRIGAVTTPGVTLEHLRGGAEQDTRTARTA